MLQAQAAEQAGAGYYERNAGRQVYRNATRDRSMKEVRLVVSDAHAGLANSIQKHFKVTSWQRCQTHFSPTFWTSAPRVYRRISSNNFAVSTNLQHGDGKTSASKVLLRSLEKKLPRP